MKLSLSYNFDDLRKSRWGEPNFDLKFPDQVSNTSGTGLITKELLPIEIISL